MFFKLLYLFLTYIYLIIYLKIINNKNKQTMTTMLINEVLTNDLRIAKIAEDLKIEFQDPQPSYNDYLFLLQTMPDSLLKYINARLRVFCHITYDLSHLPTLNTRKAIISLCIKDYINQSYLKTEVDF